MSRLLSVRKKKELLLPKIKLVYNDYRELFEDRFVRELPINENTTQMVYYF